MTPIMAVARFESLFRKSASLDVDKDDLKRLGDLLGKKLYDLLVVAKATAKANGRDIVLAHDLPVTAGLRRSIHDFDELDEELALDPILERLAVHPPLEMTYGADVDELLPHLLGGLTVALARTFRILDPSLVNPTTTHWERAVAVFDTLL